ncbi:MAG: hypothetical protein IJT21_04680 [Synergistaceae bacterium]|nr:hypothetical protein [Synergistaceae bacterium]
MQSPNLKDYLQSCLQSAKNFTIKKFCDFSEAVIAVIEEIIQKKADRSDVDKIYQILKEKGIYDNAAPEKLKEV